MGRKLIKVLLVDDEPFIRQGLRQLINWEDYGYTICGEAGNGLEAIDFIENNKVDLVFADLKMPQMTGLELIDTLSKDRTRQLRFVILTGFAEFEYVRAAMQMKVSDYILKPIQEPELIELLQKIRQEYKDDEAEIGDFVEDKIWQLLSGKFSGSDLTDIRGFVVEGSRCSFVSFEVSGLKLEKIDEITREKLLDYQRHLVSGLKTILGDLAYHVVANRQDEEVYGAGLILTDTMLLKLGKKEGDYLDYLIERLSKLLDFKFVVIQGKTVDSFENLKESLRSVNVTRSFYKLVDDGDLLHKSEELETSSTQVILDKADTRELIKAVKANDEEAIAEAIDHIWVKVMGSAYNLESLKTCFYHVMFCLMELAREFEDENDQREVLGFISRENFDQLLLQGDSSQIKRFVIDYAGYLNEVRNQEKKGTIDSVVEYLQEHYNENLSLKALGDMFFVNSVYLGQLFKAKYGVLYKDYVNELRITKAKEYLLNTDMRIYAIAEKVGFKKADTFISKFVALNGLTPNQYRIKNQQK